MEPDRITRSRSTVVVPGDHRVRGTYEQCAGEADDGAVARRRPVGARAGLTVDGLVDGPVRLGFAELRMLAGADRLSRFDAAEIPLVDLLAVARVDVGAEVLCVRRPDEGLLAFRIDSLLGTDARLELGTLDDEGRRDWCAPIRLVGSTLLGGRPVAVASVHLTTFGAFIDGTTDPGTR